MVPRAALAALAALGCGALAGCSLITDSFVTNDFSGDPFPIHIARESGAVMVGVRTDGGANLVAVLDVLSPVTLTDPGDVDAVSVYTSDLTLLGRREPGTGELELPRARLGAASVISLHPCSEEVCTVGVPEAGTDLPFGAIVGANVLAGDALRLRLGDDRAYLLADIGGDDLDRTFVCDAVFPAPYRGGGTLIIGGTEVPFGGRRVTLRACLGAEPDPAVPIPQTERGSNALLVMSTGIGTSILGRTAYERYRLALAKSPTPPAAFEALPERTVFLPSGAVFGRVGTVDRLALAAASSSSSRAPCRQAYAHRFLAGRDCTPNEEGCPCDGDNEFCSVPAVVELEPPGGLQILIVDDDNATLQALRAELRPDQPEVDGILGADALETAELDIDYPHNRVLARCTAPGCVARPALAEEGDREQVNNCISLAP